MRRWLPWIVSALLSIGLLWYLLSQIDPRELWRVARSVDRTALAAFGAATILGVAARATRFWLLLARRVRWSFLAAVTLARGLFIDLLPSRLGELSYVYLLTTRAGRPLEEGLSTLVLSILFDVVALGPLIVLAVVAVGGGELVPGGMAGGTRRRDGHPGVRGDSAGRAHCATRSRGGWRAARRGASTTWR